MTAQLFVIAATVAVVAAMRSLWSPCGLSMLSTLNPVSERGRGHRYPPTVAWFLAGALAGGALFGAGAAVGASLLRLAHPSPSVVLSAAAVASAVSIAAERGWLGLRLPVHPRQVDESWTHRYRRFVYASGYGVQIGAGFATYIMTTAVYLTAALAVLTADPLAALAVGLIFGAIRGLAIIIGAAGNRPDRLRSVHRRLDELEPASEVAALGVQVVAVVAAGGLLAGSAIPGLVAVLALLVLVAVTAARALRTSPAANVGEAGAAGPGLGARFEPASTVGAPGRSA